LTGSLASLVSQKRDNAPIKETEQLAVTIKDMTKDAEQCTAEHEAPKEELENARLQIAALEDYKLQAAHSKKSVPRTLVHFVNASDFTEPNCRAIRHTSYT